MSGPYEPTPDEQRVIAWLRDFILGLPEASFVWALLHPIKFAEIYGAQKAALKAIAAIEQGHHHD
jgi:hypothetical protein